MKKLLVLAMVVTSVLSGCASVPMESELQSNQAKKFQAPSPDTAGLYVFRKDTFVGQALKKDIWVNEKCVGETAKGVFFYKEVKGGKDLSVSTESEFSENNLVVKTESGKLYFVEQYIKMGVFVGGAGLEQHDIKSGKKEVLKLKLAKTGKCNN